jgi:hypothetical protein
MTRRPAGETTGIFSRDEEDADAALPPVATTRWVIRRKAQVVAAVRDGRLGLDEACRRYALTVDEFQTWQTIIDRHGPDGLRATRLQHYRRRGRAAEG